MPAALLRHLGVELGIATPELASVRALYARGRTLFDHQQQACDYLGSAWMSEHQRRALVRVLRDEVAHCDDRERLFTHARRWLHDHKLLIPHDRVIRTLVASALAELEQPSRGKHQWRWGRSAARLRGHRQPLRASVDIQPMHRIAPTRLMNDANRSASLS